jgi:hypothetical protein
MKGIKMKSDPWWMKIKLTESYGPKGPIMKWWIRPAAFIIAVFFGITLYIVRV